MTEIDTLERAALAGLPALRSDNVGGWILRRSQGFSRRANSVIPLQAAGADPGAPAGDAAAALGARIAHCESIYARQGPPCRFKMTRASRPAGLDAALAARGYRRDAETLVQVLGLADGTLAAAPEPTGVSIETHAAPTEFWLDTWARLSERGARVDLLARLLAMIGEPSLYVWVRDGDTGVACARATIAHGMVGLYDLLVSPAHRRRGLATALVRARLDWARRQGVGRAFLQVMAGNEGARAVQQQLGFGEAYRYWYRQQS